MASRPAVHQQVATGTPPAREAVRVGIVGAGMVSAYYARGCSRFDDVEIVACADADAERARALAREWSIEARSVDELLADPAVDLVLNLTPPQAHAPVSLAALAAGKHVYSEKPLGATFADGVAVAEAARAAGLRLGCAPDTFLGGGLQTCRTLVDEGAIGRPVAATACMIGRGVESWHPAPQFLFQPGGGPHLDMGPYYVTALVHLLGPVARVQGLANAPSAERVIEAPGGRIRVSVPTHVAGLLEFAAGPAATLLMSWEGWATDHPAIEVYGEEATMSVPDPNYFGGPVRIRGAGSSWTDVALTHSADHERGIGVADLAHALRTGRAHRASSELALHVLEVLTALEESSRTGSRVTLETTCGRPAPLPSGLPERSLDD
jgi:predicted dehydrogenase